MPPTSTDLDMFILALVQRGCGTPYELKAKAGISIGSSAPVLERLTKGGFLKKSAPGVRGKAHFAIATKGKKTLDSGWKALLGSRYTDADAILRITYLAWALGEQYAMTEFVDSAARTLGNAAAIRRAEADQLQGVFSAVGAEAFRWLKTRFEAARLEAQSLELKELGKQIRKQKNK
jgi:DNA-binding PadR family transcriptional regulator